MSKSEVQPCTTGLAFLQQALISGGLGNGIGHTLGLSLETVNEDHVSLIGRPSMGHANPMGAVHGGYLATMLDGAMALALQTHLDMGTPYATTNLNVSYVKGVTPSSGILRCIGKLIHRGRTLALARADVTSGDGTLHAHAIATFAIVDRKP